MPKYEDEIHNINTKTPSDKQILLGDSQPRNPELDPNNSRFHSPLQTEALPPPPTPPQSRNNLTISPQISVVSEVGDIPPGVLNKEEPKYARVDIKNKRNSKQLANGNCSAANAPMEGPSYV